MAALWAALFVIPDAIARGPAAAVADLTAATLLEYLPFVLLLGALFVVAGGIRVTGTPNGTPSVNTLLLAIGAALGSVIGTTGAAMVMIRPLMRANRRRPRTTHVFVYFIILVANVGGALTPLGNPPLFLGFLAGVPFLWPLRHAALPTAVVTLGLLASFFAIDRTISRRSPTPALEEIEKLGLEGAANLALLAAVVAAVMLRAVWHASAGPRVFGVLWDYPAMVTDAAFLVIAALSLRLTPPGVRRRNEFSWTPMVEVAIVFAGIFVTLVPVMAMIVAGPAGPAAPLVARLFASGRPDDHLFYWATGVLSALLDNAPTYLVFFGFAGGDPVRLVADLPRTLLAISVASAYFGALTYLGNAPNLMVKAIAESHGFPMPGFLAFIGWAGLCLLPWLLVVDVLFLG